MNGNNTYTLGIDIGSTTVKVAVLDQENQLLFSDYERHFANIQETLADLLEKAEGELGDLTVYPAITGSGGLTLARHLEVPFIQEVVAVATALEKQRPRPMWLLSWAARTRKSFILRAAMWNSV